jgi:hypothetical protein
MIGVIIAYSAVARKRVLRMPNQKSKIKNQKSKIKNQKSKIKNQKSKIKNQKSFMPPIALPAARLYNRCQR